MSSFVARVMNLRYTDFILHWSSCTVVQIFTPVLGLQMTQLRSTGVGQVDMIQRFMSCSSSYFQMSTVFHSFSQTWLTQDFQIIFRACFERL